MKGLVLAGGAGKRLRPLTHTGAKQLVPVANKPILFYVVENLVAAGITEIGVVVSPETGREVREALGDGDRFGARIAYIEQDRPGGLAHAAKIAQPYLGDDDFVMFLGDNLVGRDIGDLVEAFRVDSSDAHVLLQSVDDPRRFGVAEVDADGCVRSLVEKPTAPRSNLALVGVYLFRASIFGAIERIRPSARGELEITDAISDLIAGGGQCRFTQLDSWWLDTGKKDDLLLANDTVLDHWLEPHTAGAVDEASTIQGRVRVEAGARVVRSTVRGPAIIGHDACIVDARIGPFTSVGARVAIERSRVEHSVLMEDARVIDVSHLEDSLVGRRVVVRGGNAGAALSLNVGDDSVVEVPA